MTSLLDRINDVNRDAYTDAQWNEYLIDILAKAKECDYYTNLGLNIDESLDITELTKNYKKLARIFHPDKNAKKPYADVSAELFKYVSNAKDILIDPIKETNYRRSEFSTGFGMPRGRKRPARGNHSSPTTMHHAPFPYAEFMAEPTKKRYTVIEVPHSFFGDYYGFNDSERNQYDMEQIKKGNFYHHSSVDSIDLKALINTILTWALPQHGHRVIVEYDLVGNFYLFRRFSNETFSVSFLNEQECPLIVPIRVDEEFDGIFVRKMETENIAKHNDFWDELIQKAQLNARILQNDASEHIDFDDISMEQIPEQFREFAKEIYLKKVKEFSEELTSIILGSEKELNETHLVEGISKEKDEVIVPDNKASFWSKSVFKDKAKDMVNKLPGFKI
jgi:curved DNA-binding protein CbpA